MNSLIIKKLVFILKIIPLSPFAKGGCRKFRFGKGYFYATVRFSWGNSDLLQVL